MGWVPGSGLGPNGNGIRDPIHAVMRRSKQGLGHWLCMCWPMTSLPYVSCHCDSFDAFDSFSFTITRLITGRPECHFSFYNFHPCDCECRLVALLYIYVVPKCSWTVKMQVTLIDGYTRHHRSIEEGRINRGVVWCTRPAQYSHIYSTCIRTVFHLVIYIVNLYADNPIIIILCMNMAVSPSSHCSYIQGVDLIKVTSWFKCVCSMFISHHTHELSKTTSHNYVSVKLWRARSKTKCATLRK